MLNMRVEDYRITSDANGITVNRLRRDKDKQPIMVVNRYSELEEEATDLVGYYPTIEVALRGITRHYTNTEATGELTTIKEFKDAVDTIVAEFKEALQLEEA